MSFDERSQPTRTTHHWDVRRAARTARDCHYDTIQRGRTRKGRSWALGRTPRAGHMWSDERAGNLHPQYVATPQPSRVAEDWRVNGLPAFQAGGYAPAQHDVQSLTAPRTRFLAWVRGRSSGSPCPPPLRWCIPASCQDARPLRPQPRTAAPRRSLGFGVTEEAPLLARVWAQAKEKQAAKVNEWGRVLQMGEFARQVNAAQHHEAYAYERRRQQVCCTAGRASRDRPHELIRVT